MNMLRLAGAAAILVSLAIGGCAAPASKSTGIDPAERQLAEAFTRIAESYEQLALIQSAQDQADYRAQSYSYSDANLPPKWLQEVVLLEDYHGDLVSFIQMLSVMAGMEAPRIVRTRAGQPIIVAVAKGRRKLISFMADVGHQADGRALVKPVVELDQILVEYNQ